MDKQSNLFDYAPIKKTEYSVTEISNKIKKLIEENFEFIRVRGEISSFKIAPSGHAYFSLKDDKSILASICWKGNISNLRCKPEEGLEVICTGNITTYGGQSKYQLIVNSMELAGIGALMALLEKRKKQFQDEGLFDPKHKKPIPFLPQSIGVVTSITGAVIRDIIHRISDRFPVKITIWPVLVQGPEAANQITAAINGFNNLSKDKPDVLIVARGGGSIEDLWAFNEENVVRAVFNSSIPVISAVGHETDTTLIDFVADKRAPTPTAAAEMAVPVRYDLIFTIDELEHRLSHIINRRLDHIKTELLAHMRALPNINKILFEYIQKIDDWSCRKDRGIQGYFDNKKYNLELLSSKIIHPIQYLESAYDKLNNLTKGLDQALANTLNNYKQQFEELKYQINPKDLLQSFEEQSEKIKYLNHSLNFAAKTKASEKEMSLTATISLYNSYNYKNTLKRGFALVKKDENHIIKSVKELNHSETYSLQIADGATSIRLSPPKN